MKVLIKKLINVLPIVILFLPFILMYVPIKIIYKFIKSKSKQRILVEDEE